jgi:hypothetical protein
LTVEWKGWRGCCAPHTMDSKGAFEGVKFIACE